MPKLKKKTDRNLVRAWYKGKQFYGTTEAEAKAKRDEYKYECEHGIERNVPITVYDFVSSWLPSAKANVAKNTYNQYASILETMTSVIGDKMMNAVTPSDISRVWAQFVGKSHSEISKAKFLYKAVFQAGIENGHCSYNPVLSGSAQPHRGTKGTHRALESWEIDLIKTVQHRCQRAAMFMLFGGFRRGEILAMTKDDIFEGRIRVFEAVKFDNNRPVIGKPKNDSSVRFVPLFDALKPFYEAMQDGEYILPDRNGKLCSETAFRRVWESYLSDLSEAYNGCPKRWWHLTKEWKSSHPQEYGRYLSMKKAAGKDPDALAKAEAYRLRGWRSVSFRPHDLRHTFVTLCRNRGVDIHVCMSWCGHSSERMILEIYDHVSEGREQTATELMNA